MPIIHYYLTQLTRENLTKVSDIEQAGEEVNLASQQISLPETNPYIIKFTEAGPGVSVLNYEVKFRDIDISKLCKSGLRYRVCLVSDENETEQTNSCP